MKTLIATLALTLAASTAAVAGQSEISERGIAAALQYEAPASVQVSGFTGVAGDFTNMNSDPSEAGLPFSLQNGNEADVTVSGFTGIANADVVVIEDELGGKGGNL